MNTHCQGLDWNPDTLAQLRSTFFVDPSTANLQRNILRVNYAFSQMRKYNLQKLKLSKSGGGRTGLQSPSLGFLLQYSRCFLEPDEH